MRSSFTIITICVVFPFAVLAQEFDYKSLTNQCLKEAREKNLSFEEEYQYRKQCIIGLTAPNFQAISITKEKIELEKLRGEVVVLYFWYVSCGDPRLGQLPGLNEVVKKYRFRDVHFLALTDSEPVTILEEFLPQHEFWFKIIPNAQEIIWETFNN